MISWLPKTANLKYVAPLVAALAGGCANAPPEPQRPERDAFTCAATDPKPQQPDWLAKTTNGVMSLSPYSPSSHAFQRLSLKGYQRLPDHLRAFLESQAKKGQILLGCFSDEIRLPNGVRMSGEPYGPGSKLRNSSGWSLATQPPIAGIAEKVESLCTPGTVATVEPVEVERAATHEGFHQIDASIPYTSADGLEIGIKSWPPLIDAYEKDLKRLAKSNPYIRQHLETRKTRFNHVDCLAEQDPEFLALEQEEKAHPHSEAVRLKRQQFDAYHKLSYMLIQEPAMRGRSEAAAMVVESLLHRGSRENDDLILSSFPNTVRLMQENVLDPEGFARMLASIQATEGKRVAENR